MHNVDSRGRNPLIISEVNMPIPRSMMQHPPTHNSSKASGILLSITASQMFEKASASILFPAMSSSTSLSIAPLRMNFPNPSAQPASNSVSIHQQLFERLPNSHSFWRCTFDRMTPSRILFRPSVPIGLFVRPSSTNDKSPRCSESFKASAPFAVILVSRDKIRATAIPRR